jgi:dipeptidyl aminopeptidase/acylaminoacyl peptidase
MLQPVRLDDAAPWKRRFRTPRIFWTWVAWASPTRGLALGNHSGVLQLYAWDVPTGRLRQLTDRPQGVISGLLSPDGRYVYYLADQDGNEIGHLVRVPFEGGPSVDLTPEMTPYENWWRTISRAGNLLAFTLANRDGHQAYCFNLGPGDTVGPPRLLHQSAHEFWSPVLSHGGELAVIASTARAGRRQYSLLAFDTIRRTQIAELWDGPGTSIRPELFSPVPGDDRLLAVTNRTGIDRPLLWNPRTGERVDFPLDDLDGETDLWDWSPDGSQLLLSQISRAVQHFYLYHLGTGTRTPLEHPHGTFGTTYFTPQGEIFAQWQDATHPSCLIALDGKTGRQTRTVLTAGDVPSGHPWQSVTFASSDGQPIQGWLGVPDGVGPFPTILEMHGGPQAVTREYFSPTSQAWLDNGFAYLTINYRGSTTFGRTFEEQIWGHPGDWELEDIVAARTWLVQRGVARADQILLTGWSYGGYLTLFALGKRPDLWAGGMAGVAIGDFRLQYEDASESLKQWVVTMLGGTPEERPAQYAASSPLTYAEHVRAPVLMIQGRNDTRTPARQAKAYVAKMQGLGKDIEVVWYEAGHLTTSVDRAIDHMERMLRFAARVLK